MSKKPFFSVIIPTLNEEKYLSTVLKSLSHQTLRDFELIVVDGNSKDGTEMVFQKLAPLMPKASFYITDKSNVGHQRNFGAGRAKGEYFIFLDADVDMSHTFLEEIHIEAIKQKFLLATTWMIPDSNKSIDQAMILLGNLGMELVKGINKPGAGGYNIIVKRQAFETIGSFREDLPISEDHDFIYRAYKKNIEMKILKEPRIVISLRRFRSEGTLKVLRKYAQAQLHMLLKGPITTELFDYPMGGHVHTERRKRRRLLAYFKRYLGEIEKFQDKITRLLKE